MKVLGWILIFVTIAHAQCAGACPAELLLSAGVAATASGPVAVQPPCHRNHETSPKQPNDSLPQRENTCASGVAVAVKVRNSDKTSVQLNDLVATPLAEGFCAYRAAPFATVHTGQPPSPMRPALRDLVLRI